MEIERKWLLKDEPNLVYDEMYLIYQSYLVSSDNLEVRIREANLIFNKTDLPPMSMYSLTIKTGEGLSREEVNLELDECRYGTLKQTIKDRPIIKIYKSAMLPDGHIAEVSDVDNKWRYLEIEFDTEEQANNYVLPENIQSFVVKEVTNLSYYSMKEYWNDRDTRC